MTAGKILVADDNHSIRRLFEIGLRETSFEVVTVKNGLEALEKLKKVHFDLLIIDLRMPGLDGLETIEKVRNFNSDIPIILQGSFKTKETSLRAKELKVAAYLVKPFDWLKMAETIERLIGIGRGK